MSKVFVSILLTISAITAHSQDPINKVLNWYDEPNPVTKCLWFEGACYPYENDIAPYFNEAIPLPNSDSIDYYDVEIISTQWEPIHGNMVFESKDLQKNIQPEIQRLRTGDKSFIHFTYPTLRANSSGDTEKLVSITYRIIRKKNIDKKSFNIHKVQLSNSVLSSGKWVKIGVSRSGVYKVTYAELLQYGFSDPTNISLWGNGGRELPLMNNVEGYDAILPIPIFMEKGSDGVFNQGDYILFYAEGPETLLYNDSYGKWKWKKHGYTNTIYYFLTTSQPQLIMQTAETPAEVENYSTTSFDQVTTFEKNDTNLVKSGREWFGEIFDVVTSYSYNITTPHLLVSSPFSIWVRLAARSASASSFTLRYNGTSSNINVNSVPIGDELANVVSVTEQFFNGFTSSQSLNIEVVYNKPLSGSVGFMDFISVQTRHELAFNGSQMIFRDFSSVGANRIAKFSVGNSTATTQIWDITNIHEVKRINTNLSGGIITYKQSTETLKTYIAFDPGKAYSIESYTSIGNQNIRGNGFYNYFIVTHPQFNPQAEELAQLHRQRSNLSVAVYTTTEVYNEFSGGNPDVAAIRNMLRYFYRAATSDEDKPKYLLLFGDGSYDNLSNKTGNTNFILTYQSEWSINPVSSFVTDDFFGLLDDNEGEGSGFLDVGIGRFPVSTPEQAANLVSKVKRYLDDEEVDDWQSKLVFIADDEDGNVHMQDANSLAKYIEENHPAYNIQKIFFDAFPQETLPGGQRYPRVTQAINSAVNNGALLVNYTGHGNERWLAHEKVLMLQDVLSWKNAKRLPLFVTATCEFSRFDDYHNTSTGEWVLLNPNGGAIAMLTTTRLVYSSPNFTLNYNFVQQLFGTNANGEFYRLGDLIRITKNLSGTGYNKLNFTLLGDPALRLRYPWYRVNVSQINHKDISEPTDTLKALEKVNIKGDVVNSSNIKINSFNGRVTVTVYDKEKTITTLTNDGGSPMNIKVRDNTLFKGFATVQNGSFTIDFTVPKDINYAYGKGKISLFAYDGLRAALGYHDSIIVGGIGSPVQIDNEGPAIEIFLNDMKFRNGGIADSNPLLLIHLSDPSGINTTGIGIGHDLTATVTYPYGQSTDINLNEFYKANINDYTHGKAEYRLTGLPEGLYKVEVKAWDTFNNSSKGSLTFRVLAEGKPTITNFYCTPNPVSNFTHFYFESNVLTIQNVKIEIFDLSGTKVAELWKNNVFTGGYRIGPLEWNATNFNGAKLSKGIYIARLTANLGNTSQRATTKILLY